MIRRSMRGIVGTVYVAMVTALPLAWCHRTSAAPEHDEDQAICERQLRLLYDAIENYRAAHQGWPESLSDLVPDFIDSKIKGCLRCPVAKTEGGSALDQTIRTAFPQDDASTSYSYEFSPLTDVVSKLSPRFGVRSMQEYKLLQLIQVGNVVPLVRCDYHRDANGNGDDYINLAHDGSVYRSGFFWEALAAGTEQERLDPDPLFAEILHVFQSAARRANVPPERIDTLTVYPATLASIPVPRHCHAIYLLGPHPEPGGKANETGHIVLKWAQGIEETIHLNDPQVHTIPLPRFAWPVLLQHPPADSFRFTAWQNPTPGSAIESAEFVLPVEDTSPTLIGISAAQTGSSPPSSETDTPKGL